MNAHRLAHLSFMTNLRHERQDDSDAERPATEEEINRITGESDQWAPSAAEWTLLIGISAVALAIRSMIG